MAEVNIALARLQAENPLFTHRDVSNPEHKPGVADEMHLPNFCTLSSTPSSGIWGLLFIFRSVGYAYNLKWVMNTLSRNLSRVSDEGLATSVHREVQARP
jgi:hypothetical protein